MARPNNSVSNFTSVPRYEDNELKMTIDESQEPYSLIIKDKLSGASFTVSSSTVNDITKMLRSFKALSEKNEVKSVGEAIEQIKDELACDSTKTVSATAIKASDSKVSK
jgi:hypothetical protein